MDETKPDEKENAEESQQEPENFWLRFLNGTVHYNSAILKEGWANLLARLFRYFFGRMNFEAHPDAERAASKGSVIYALMNPSRIEFLFLHTRAREKGLTPPTFGHYFSLALFQPIWVLIKRAVAIIYSLFKFKRYPNPYKDGYVKDRLEQGEASCVFLREFEGLPRRFKLRKKDALAQLFELRPKSRPLFVVPVMFSYSKLLPRESRRFFDVFWGPKEHPGRIRRLALLIRYHNRALARVLEPIDLEEFIEQNSSKVPYTQNRLNELAYLLRSECLDRIYRAQRAVVGPQLRSRREIIETLAHDQEISERIAQLAGGDPQKFEKLRRQVRRYAGEIAADYNTAFLNFMDMMLTILWKRIFSEIEVGEERIAAIQKLAERYPIVYVPCHKSHLDYLLQPYVLFYHHLNPPHIAAGINLSVWPIGPIFRRCGAFFIRRSFKGMELYPLVFSKYVELLLKEQANIEFFIEGGRSRTGKMLIPKLGFLSIMLSHIKKAEVEDLVFVPVSIAYEHLFEERTFIKEQTGQKQKAPYLPKGFFKHKSRVCIDFSEPFFAKRYLEEVQVGLPDDKEGLMAAANYIAHRVVWDINRIQRVTLRALAAYVLLSTTKKGMLYPEIVRRSFKMVEILEHQSAPFASNIDRQGLWLDAALKKLSDEHAIKIVREPAGEAQEDICLIPEDKRLRLTLYKNSIIHWLQDEAIALIANVCCEAANMSEMELFRWLRELLRGELIFGPQPSETSEEIDEKYGTAMSILDRAGASGDAHTKELVASAVLHFLEGYYTALQAVSRTPKRAFSERELVRIALKMSEKLHQLGEIQRPESGNRILFSTALSALTKLGALKGKEVVTGEGRAERIYEKHNPEQLKLISDRLRAILSLCK